MLNLRRDLARPQGELVSVHGDELMADLCHMVDKPEFLASQ